ncbi:MAG TPA: VCBS repeat-containing protein [Acidimicrobiales bacterium]|nr:VCBS repeat-containing protein [Acidimicrobiales bacterium]
MTGGPDTREAELVRRLADAAATTTTDPGAWEAIAARTGLATSLTAAGGRSRPPRRLPRSRRRAPLAAAVLAVAALAAAALVAQGGGDDRLRTADDPPPTAPPPTPPASDRPVPTLPGATVPPAGGEVPPPGDPATEPVCPQDPAFTCGRADTGDVDGDGRVDAVGLYAPPPATFGEGPFTVRVVYASGTVDEVALVGNSATARLLGVTDLDGDGREEVVYAHVPGAHTWWGGFLGTAGTGRLHPVGFPEEQALYDAAATVVGGFSCPDLDGDGRNELVVAYASLEDAETRIVTTTYRWAEGTLEQTDERTETVPGGIAAGRTISEVAGSRGGIRCGDLAGSPEG